MPEARSRRSSAAKQRIRDRVWDRLVDEGVARFPFPPHGRIPNFAGSERAAARLFELPPLQGVRHIKVNPDAPQRPVRSEALRRGLTVFMPTPRLRAGFLRLDPARIPEREWRRAASLSGAAKWGEPVSLDDLPPLDALVVGSVAVSRSGARCGKGEGYADLEYGILRSLGHPPVPVLTSVHGLQIEPRVPRDAMDLPLAWIATPEESIAVRDPAPPPSGIDWDRLDEADLDAMPILRELRERG